MKKICFLVFMNLFLACSNSNNERKSLESQYHEEIVKIKGRDVYFIPFKEISWYFQESNWVQSQDLRVNDVVCFFDTTGNIQYQALINQVSKVDTIIYVLDFRSNEFYNTTLNRNNIRGFENEKLAFYKFYRHPPH